MALSTLEMEYLLYLKRTTQSAQPGEGGGSGGSGGYGGGAGGSPDGGTGSGSPGNPPPSSQKPPATVEIEGVAYDTVEVGGTYYFVRQGTVEGRTVFKVNGWGGDGYSLELATGDFWNRYSIVDTHEATPGGGGAPDAGSPGGGTPDGGMGGSTVRYSTTIFKTSNGYEAIKTTLGSFGDDVIVNGGIVAAGAGNDTVVGSLANGDTLDGGDGNDVLHGGSDGDLLIGGAGFDMASYAFAFFGVHASLSNASASDDSFRSIEGLTGSAHADWLEGSAESNLIQGGAGDDILIGGWGNDTLDGGEGSDTVRYDDTPYGVTVNLASSGLNTGAAVGDVYVSIENVVGSSAGDHLIGNDVANRLEGGAGDDTLDGGAGNDVLVSGSGANVLYGGAGDDLLYLDAGSAFLMAGAGSDTFKIAYGASYANIHDFAVGADKIAVDHRIFADYAQLLAGASQQDGYTLLWSAAGTTITLNDVLLSSLSANDFLFV